METLLQATGLVKSYGARTVVDGIDLQIGRGEVLAVIGPNGAGKSTTLDLLLGLKRPDRGHVAYWRDQPFRHIGVQLQSTPFFPGFTALENMRMFAAFYGLRPKDPDLLLMLSKCGLAESAFTDAGKLSGGQQKRLAIAMTLMHGPDLVFLDEPTAALDPRARRDIRELIGSLAASGTTVVFTSHDMEEVHKLATRIVMVCAGTIRTVGRPVDLLAQHQADSLEALYIQLSEEVQ